MDYFVHESSYVDEGAEIGKGTKIWHFSHILRGAKIGEYCNLGQNVSVAGGTVIGNHVKVQNNVSVYEGTVIEDDVFLGPSCVLTNVTNPRSQVLRKSLYEKTLIRRGRFHRCQCDGCVRHHHRQVCVYRRRCGDRQGCPRLRSRDRGSGASKRVDEPSWPRSQGS